LEYSRVRLITLSGIDTATANAGLLFAVESAFASAYLRDLRAKTLRGLEGRALAGFATGGVAYGFALRKELDADGKPLGSRPIVDPVQAKVIRRIFALYLDGFSLAGIAKRLNKDGVPPPRVHVKGRRTGWKDTTIRSILRNRTYVGVWTFKAKEWRKLPGTNLRRYTQRDAAQVIEQRRSHLAIIDEDTWAAVEERLRAVSAQYTKTTTGQPKGCSLPGRATPYLFSSLLFCATCGGKMVISGGSSKAYYRCEAYSKRGSCKNGLSVPEAVVRSNLLNELRRRLTWRDALAYARKKIAEKPGRSLASRTPSTSSTTRALKR
jgi:site-specific DNA recombinase